MFISTADALFGPITTIHDQGKTIRHIPWIAFKFMMADWERVNDTHTIIAVCGSILTLTPFTHHGAGHKQYITSLWNNNLHFGTAFPPSKNFKLHGKQSLQFRSTSFTNVPFKMDSTNSESTTRSSTTNQYTSLHLVSNYISTLAYR